MKNKGVLVSVLLFIGAILLFAIGFQNSGEANQKEDLARVEKAIQKAIIECYSVEGEYPDSLSYLKENYGLYINEDKYTVHFVYVASNLMPENKVFEKGNAYE